MLFPEEVDNVRSVFRVSWVGQSPRIYRGFGCFRGLSYVLFSRVQICYALQPPWSDLYLSLVIWALYLWLTPCQISFGDRFNIHEHKEHVSRMASMLFSFSDECYSFYIWFSSWLLITWSNCIFSRKASPHLCLKPPLALCWLCSILSCLSVSSFSNKPSTFKLSHLITQL